MAVQWLHVHFFPILPTHNITPAIEDDTDCPDTDKNEYRNCVKQALSRTATDDSALNVQKISRLIKDGNCTRLEDHQLLFQSRDRPLATEIRVKNENAPIMDEISRSVPVFSDENLKSIYPIVLKNWPTFLTEITAICVGKQDPTFSKAP